MTTATSQPYPSEESAPWLTIAGRPLYSRLIVGTEQYDSAELIRTVFANSNSELLIVAASLGDSSPGLPLSAVLSRLDGGMPIMISTTSLASSVSDAISIARLLRESLDVQSVKLDVRPDTLRSIPDNRLTIDAARILISEGFEVVPMITPDRVAAVELERIGCKALRLMAGPLRKGAGIANLQLMLSVKREVGVPCIGEGGVGTCSDVALMMQSGMDAVLVNTAIARSSNPPLMARAMRLAVAAGRDCYLAGRMPVETDPT